MSDRSTSCADRIEAELATTEQGYTELWQRLDNQDADYIEYDAVYEELEPLAISVKPVVTVQLSWGGPSDWLEIGLDGTEHGYIEYVTYHFADWFDHAERQLPEYEAPAIWRAAEYYAEVARNV
jgi:hypothetical protein